MGVLGDRKHLRWDATATLHGQLPSSAHHLPGWRGRGRVLGEVRACCRRADGSASSKRGALSVKYEHLELRAYDSVRAARADIAQNLKWYNSEPAHSSFDDATPAQHYVNALPNPKQAAKDEIFGAPRVAHCVGRFAASADRCRRRPLHHHQPAVMNWGNLSRRAGPSMQGRLAGGARAGGGGKQFRPQCKILQGAMSLAILLDGPHR